MGDKEVTRISSITLLLLQRPQADNPTRAIMHLNSSTQRAALRHAFTQKDLSQPRERRMFSPNLSRIILLKTKLLLRQNHFSIHLTQ